MPYDLERKDEEPIVIDFDNKGNLKSIVGITKAKNLKKQMNKLKGMFNNE